ncbi:MAG: M56 family metallopeptidase [Eubacterium sp.]|nr:M56 family metallopeptidase [Eubacterium sp.]
MLQLLIYMNATGSIFCLLHMLMLPIEKRYLPPNYRVLICRLNLMLFTIPFPAILYYIRRYLERIFSDMPLDPNIYNGAHFIIHLEQNFCFAFPKLENYQILLVLSWIIVLLLRYHKTFKKNHRLRKYNKHFELFEDEEITENSIDIPKLVQEALTELHLKIKPRTFVLHGISTPHISGIFRPKLCMPSDWNVSEQVHYMAIKHEFAHVLNKDLLFLYFARIAKILFWFNPFVYLSCNLMFHCEESAADACACENASAEDIREYQTALLDLITDDSNSDIAAKGFKIKFQNNKKAIIERIFIMKNKDLYKHKFLKFAAASVMSIVMFAVSSIPALAYNLPATITNEQISVNSVDVVSVDTLPTDCETDSLLISAESFEDDLYFASSDLDFSKSDWYCVDKNGNVYEYINEPRISCIHNYVAAQVSHHSKNSDGSCTIVYHKAKRCSKCGHIVVLELIATTTFVKCTH